jgi:hypothetical protein
MRKEIIAFVLMLAALSAAESAFAQNGVIKEMSGTVELKNTNAADFTLAKAGDIVKQDTVVSTGFKSTALIEIGSTIITVRPLTRLTLKEIKASAESETLNVSLQTGRVRVDVKPPADRKASMSVSTPTATASVRGTSFELDARNLYVINGKVLFKGTRGVYTLITTGSESAVDENGIAQNPLSFGYAAYLPPMPVGTQSYASPAATAARSGTETPTDDTSNVGVGIGYN